MAKMQSVLFNEISGRLGPGIQSQTYKGHKILRKFTPPRNPNTNPQAAQRSLYAGEKYIWQTLVSLNPNIRSSWDDRSRPKQLSGFNEYMEHGMRNEVWITLVSSTPPNWVIRLHYSCRLDPEDTLALFSIDAVSWGPIPGLNPVVIGEDIYKDFPGSGVIQVFMALGSDYVYQNTSPSSYLNCLHSLYRKNETTGEAELATIITP